MPITSKEFPQYNLCIYKHIGEISDREFLQYYGLNFSYTKNKLIDLSDTNSTFRSSDALSELTSLIETNIDKFKVKTQTAIVAPAQVSFGMARMFKGFSVLIPWEISVFRIKEEALKWLGVTEELY